jgi:polar amino acid transport system permease protein
MEDTPLGTPVPDTTLSAHNPVARINSRFDAWWLLLAGVIALIAFLAITRPDPFGRIVVFVQDGILITLQVTLTSFVLVLIVGLIGGLGRISTNWFLHGLATLYVEVVRGIPLLVQILSWFFAFPAIVRNIGNQFNIPSFKDYLANPVFMVIVALTFCYGAYMSEVYRAGIQSIPKGQMEAARSLGMNYFQAMRYVILPQAIRVILPPIGNEFISLLKDSSLVSVVAVADITLRGRQFMATSYLAIETWMMVALIYLVLTLFSTRVVNWIELKTRLER